MSERDKEENMQIKMKLVLFLFLVDFVIIHHEFKELVGNPCNAQKS